MVKAVATREGNGGTEAPHDGAGQEGDEEAPTLKQLCLTSRFSKQRDLGRRISTSRVKNDAIMKRRKDDHVHWA